MLLPDSLLLGKIQAKGFYYDKKSEDPLRKGNIKEKYKLAGRQHEDLLASTLGVYRFFVATSNEASCKRETTLKIESTEWEDIDPRYKKTLQSKCSFIDIKNIDVINKIDLLSKIKDVKNGFPLVAKLSSDAYTKLVNLTRNIKKVSASNGRKSEIIKALVNDANEETMRKLGL